ncbi:MAG: hypothetical protein AAF958_11525 [Planctomycetota bacterium]
MQLGIDLWVPTIPPSHDAIGEYTATLAQTLAKSVPVRILTSTETSPTDDDAVEVHRLFDRGGRNDGRRSRGRRKSQPARFQSLIDFYKTDDQAQRLSNARSIRVGIGSGRGDESPKHGLLASSTTTEIATTTETDLALRITQRLILVQYNPFGWGRRGYAPDLLQTLREIKDVCPGVSVAVMFHERYTTRPGIRPAIMRWYQKRQFHDLARFANPCFIAVGNWGRQLESDGITDRAIHLPVGSNLPFSSVSIAQTRKRLGIPDDAVVCGVFGSAHPSRRTDWIASGLSHLRKRFAGRRAVVLLSVGSYRIPESMDADADRVIRLGRLPGDQAADAISAMDVLLSPFEDGLSTRRSSAIATLQQGTVVASTRGPSTDPLFDSIDGSSVFFAGGDGHRDWLDALDRWADAFEANSAGLSESCRQTYRQHFDWTAIAKKIIRSIPTAATLQPSEATLQPSEATLQPSEVVAGGRS